MNPFKDVFNPGLSALLLKTRRSNKSTLMFKGRSGNFGEVGVYKVKLKDKTKNTIKHSIYGRVSDFDSFKYGHETLNSEDV